MKTSINAAGIRAGEGARMDAVAQQEMPYVDAIKRYAAAGPENVMVPGHGCNPTGGGAHLAEVFGPRVVELDVPLMLDGIDLGENSPMEQARVLAADAWGAKRTWFLTNGASQGNRTAAFAVRSLGERVLMQRSSHSSFTDGVLLAGLLPAFVKPSVDEAHGIAHGLTPAALDDALREEHAAGREVSSVYVVSPSYFGSTADVAGLAAVAHSYGAALIVDGAWGAHFGFHPDLPESPARLGADLVISSTHKLAGSLTQSAMLHLGDTEFADRLLPFVDRAFTMTASTSASGILTGSLDAARHALANGEAQVGESIRLAEEFRARLRASGHFSVVSDHFDAFDDIVETDPLRIPIDVSALGESGHWVRDRLTNDHHVYFEMSTATTIVAVFGALATPDLDRIMAALETVANEALAAKAAAGAEATVPEKFPSLPDAGTLRMLPRAAFFSEAELVPAAEAVGRISADTLAAYPPGIPNLVPGEEITAETVGFLQAVAASPTGHVRGAADASVSMFRVVRDPLTATAN
ncbi:aminotransferase class I/II-fold pyridoxal phosphate-dependent enzyme [Leucobacter sp. 1207-22]|uniref:aminotransferase class I/II-fold pyridoxal phosphate-dependent enzyme n=1 Tax=Leucobacter sp. 1207-22 TaxID=2604456 RepID=UPI004062EE02